MPLYVRDDAVNDLAEKYAHMTGQSKTEAVKRALLLAIDEESNQKSLAQRVQPIQERLQALGVVADGFDDKPLMDDLSGGL